MISKPDWASNQLTPKIWTGEKPDQKTGQPKIHKIFKFWKKTYIFMCIHMNPNHYTQICKISHVYSKGAYNQNNIECNPYLNQNTSTLCCGGVPLPSHPCSRSALPKGALRNHAPWARERFAPCPVSVSLPSKGAFCSLPRELSLPKHSLH